ncbi:MAG: hypothetical protein V7647_3142 [Acidobacteriota bacterium]|jgi:hypothetical protein
MTVRAIGESSDGRLVDISRRTAAGETVAGPTTVVAAR